MKSAISAVAITLVLLLGGCGGGGGGSKEPDQTVDEGSTDPIPVPGGGSGSTPGEGGSGQVPSGPTQIAINRAAPAFAGGYAPFRWAVGRVYDMALNPATGDLVVVGHVLPGAGAGVLGLDPVSLNVRWSMATSSAGNLVAVSDDGRKLYVGLCDEHAVAQFNLPARTQEQHMSVGSANNNICASSLSVRPGHASQVVVALTGYGPLVPRDSGVVMYDNGVRLPKHASTPNGSGSFLFTDASIAKFQNASVLIGKTQHVDPGQMHRYNVTDQGVEMAQSYRYYGVSGTDFEVIGNQVFLNTGEINVLADTGEAWQLAHCRGGSFGVYTAPTPTGDQVVCINRVPEAQRRDPRAVEMEVQLFAVDGERVQRWSRLDLSAVVDVQGFATAEVDVLKLVALADNTAVLLVHHLPSQRLALISVSLADLAPATSPAVTQGFVQKDGVKVTWTSLPLLAQAVDPAHNRLVGLTPGTYGSEGSALVVMDLASKAVQSRLLLRREPKGLVLSPDGLHAYVWDTAGVYQVNLSTLAVGWTWQRVSWEVMSVAVNPALKGQVAVLEDDKVRLLVNGVSVDQQPRLTSDSGTAIRFAGPASLVEVGVRSAGYFDVQGQKLEPKATYASGLGGSSSPFIYFVDDLAYNEAGNIFDLLATTTYVYAPYDHLPDPVRGFVPLNGPTSVTLQPAVEGYLTFGVWSEVSRSYTKSFALYGGEGSRLVTSINTMPSRINDHSIVLGQYDVTRGTGATYFIEWE